MKKEKVFEEKESGICPICQRFIPAHLKHHLNKEHSDEELAQAVVEAKSIGALKGEEIGRLIIPFIGGIGLLTFQET